MRSALFDSNWGVFAVALTVGCLMLVAALVALARPRGAWLKGRLEPYADPGTDRSGAVSAPSPRWRPGTDQIHGLTERLLGETRLWRSTEWKLERARMKATPAELIFWSVALCIAALIVASLAGLSVVLVVLAGVAGLVVPTWWVAAAGRKRMHAFEAQLPDVLLSMAGSLKVGQSFNNSMQAIVDEGQEPASEEFARVLSETRLGRPMEDALTAMAERIDSEDLRFVLMSVTIQRQVGGSLADFFQTVSDTVRERQHFRRKVRALTATGRASALVLILLPVVTALLIAIVGEGYLVPLFTTQAGQVMVTVTVIMMAVGVLIIRRIVDIRG
jgi:tight adherence protein B